MAIATNMLFGFVIASCVVGGLGQLYLYYNTCSSHYYGQCRPSCRGGEFSFGTSPCASGYLGTCCAASIHCSWYGGTCKKTCDAGNNEGEYSTKVFCVTPGTRCCIRAPNSGSNTSPTPISTRREPTCGRSRPVPRISNGYTALPCEWPWMVSIWLNGNFLCSGVLVDRNTVVTSAHCASPVRSNPGSLRLIVGDYETNQKDPYEVDTTISRVIVHPDYVDGNNDVLASANNIALLKLPQDVRLQNSCLQPVCLPRSGYFPNTYDRCFIAGWGETGGVSTDQLQASSVRAVARTTCNDFIGSSSGSTISRDKLCSLPATDNSDPCLGDTGGMLVCPDVSKGQTRYVLMGIIDTFDTNCQGSIRRNNPAVYTNVVSHIDWISRHL